MTAKEKDFHRSKKESQKAEFHDDLLLRCILTLGMACVLTLLFGEYYEL